MRLAPEHRQRCRVQFRRGRSDAVAALFGRADGGRRPLPMSAADLLEAGTLIYLQGLGIGRGGPSKPD